MQEKRAGISANLLRVFATLFVFLLHGRCYLADPKKLPPVLQWLTCLPAWAGVWIFLLLSGYGIGYGFFSGRYSLRENGKLSARKFGGFYLARFLKVAPLYYLYCVFYEILSGTGYFWHNPKQLLRMLTFTFNGNAAAGGVGHLWYISIAMQLYLLMPFLYLALAPLQKKKRGLSGTLLAVLALGCAVRCLIVRLGFDWYTYSYTNCFVNLDLVAIGMLIAALKLGFDITPGHPERWKALAAVLFVGLVLYNCFIYNRATTHDTFLYRCILPSAYAAICGLLLLLSGCGATIRPRPLVTVINRFAGYSYSFYILHVASFDYLKPLLLQSSPVADLSPALQYAIFIPVAFLLTLLTAVPFQWIGKEILSRYKNRKKKEA